MASSKIPDFQSTPVESLPSIANLARTTFRTQKTKPLAYRLVQLRKFYWGLVDNSDAIIEACKRDLHKPAYETVLSELDWVKNDIVYVTQNLEKWAKDEKAEDIPLSFSVMKAHIRKEPLGTVLIIGAFNFPIQLTLGPLVGAIAAGCTAVIKPSEQAPATAMLMQKIVEQYLDPNAYVVVNGGVPETTALLEEKWDKIFYTGGQTVGTIIAKKAAETLTPVTLELGGRNPAIVTKNADIRLAARRLLWGKLHNAGQVCIGQNYILVDREVLHELVAQLKVALNEFYPKGQKNSQDYARIVNKRNFQRIKKMMDGSHGEILIGGETDESENYIEITVVWVKDQSDSLIVEESFGPLIPLLAFDNLDEAIRVANEVDPTPLGFYPFGNRSETNKLLNAITSGGASVNDAFTHGSISTIAFGGVGSSGTGSYRGRASFDCFSHRRAVTTTPGWIEKLLDVRYPPYDNKIKRYRFSSERKPNFDRDGQEIKGLKYWLALLFSLGLGKKSGFFFWGVVVLGAWLGKQKRADLIAGGSSLIATLLK